MSAAELTSFLEQHATLAPTAEKMPGGGEKVPTKGRPAAEPRALAPKLIDLRKVKEIAAQSSRAWLLAAFKGKLEPCHFCQLVLSFCSEIMVNDAHRSRMPYKEKLGAKNVQALSIESVLSNPYVGI